jgi:hypothetical protein
VSERNTDINSVVFKQTHRELIKSSQSKTMANKKKTLASKSAQPSGKKPEQPKRSVKKDVKSVTKGPDLDDEKTVNALLDGSYHLPGNDYWYVLRATCMIYCTYSSILSSRNMDSV